MRVWSFSSSGTSHDILIIRDREAEGGSGGVGGLPCHVVGVVGEGPPGVPGPGVMSGKTVQTS